MNKQTWIMMSVLRDKILKHDGMIFGGYVRDMILHDHNAMKFYKETQNDYGAHKMYSDTSYHPETAERTLIPNDIDCMFDITAFAAFKNELKNSRFTWKTVRVINPTQYFSEVTYDTTSSIQMHRLILKHDSSHLLKECKLLAGDMTTLRTLIQSHIILQPKIYMDILVTSTPFETPFISKLNFECNALYLTKHGLHVAPEICVNNPLHQQLKIQEIIQDIIAHKAVLRNIKISHDSTKLLKRGWTICDRSLSTIRDTQYDGHCIICHDELPELHMKLTCCDARYHMQCLMKCIDTTVENKGFMNECILCKTPCCITRKHARLVEHFEQSMAL
jgi:hypothetical protein